MLNRNFQEFVGLLEAKGVKYLIVGGYAVGVHGFPRYTGDIDIFAEPTPDNAERLVQVFAEFGFPNTVTKEDFLEPDSNSAIGEPPQRIHILTGIGGVTFQECYQSRTHFKSEGLNVPVIGIEALIKAKEALKRDQDELDLKRLRAVKDRAKHRRNGGEQT